MSFLSFFLVSLPEDNDLALRIFTDLRQYGSEFWTQHDTFTRETSEWEEQVRLEMQSVTAVFYVATPAAQQSPIIETFIILAQQSHKPIYSFWAGGHDWATTAPPALHSAEYLDARGTKYGQAIAHFVAQVVRESFVPARLQELGFIGRIIDGLQVIIPPTVEVPAGSLLMGSNSAKDTRAYPRELPQHEITLPTFHIGKYPLTVAEYACFLRATLRRFPSTPVLFWQAQVTKRSDHPVVNISWEDMLAYTQWLTDITRESWRMPIEAEWEKAARGPDGRLYPWGDQWDDGRAREKRALSSKGLTLPIGSFGAEASVYSIADMVGNARTWTSSMSKPYPYQPDDGREQLNVAERRIAWGSTSRSPLIEMRLAYWEVLDQQKLYLGVGGRLCSN